MIVVETGMNISRRSWAGWAGMAELVLGVLLYFFPDYAKTFLFIIPVLVLGGGAVECVYKYFSKKGGALYIIGAILLLIAVGYVLFAGRKVFMLGTVVLMLIDAIRFCMCARADRVKIFEKLLYWSVSLILCVWIFMIFSKGLDLYWSVREYLAMYFAGAAFLTLLCKR